MQTRNPYNYHRKPPQKIIFANFEALSHIRHAQGFPLLWGTRSKIIIKRQLLPRISRWNIHVFRERFVARGIGMDGNEFATCDPPWKLPVTAGIIGIILLGRELDGLVSAFCYRGTLRELRDFIIELRASSRDIRAPAVRLRSESFRAFVRKVLFCVRSVAVWFI